MSKRKITGIVIVILTVCLLTGCSYLVGMGILRSEAKEKAEQELTEDEKNAIEARGQHKFGWDLYSLGNYGDAAAAFERTLTYDPDYRANGEGYWTPEIASDFGISISDNLVYRDFSLFFFQGVMYYNVYVQSEFSDNDTLEKALASFYKGYEIDIEGGKSADKNLKTAYLGYIARFLDFLGRTDEAAASYRELAKGAKLTPEIAGRFNIPQ